MSSERITFLTSATMRFSLARLVFVFSPQIFQSWFGFKNIGKETSVEDIVDEQQHSKIVSKVRLHEEGLRYIFATGTT